MSTPNATAGQQTLHDLAARLMAGGNSYPTWEFVRTFLESWCGPEPRGTGATPLTELFGRAGDDAKGRYRELATIVTGIVTVPQAVAFAAQVEAEYGRPHPDAVRRALRAARPVRADPAEAVGARVAEIAAAETVFGRAYVDFTAMCRVYGAGTKAGGPRLYMRRELIALARLMTLHAARCGTDLATLVAERLGDAGGDRSSAADPHAADLVATVARWDAESWTEADADALAAAGCAAAAAVVEAAIRA